MIDGITVLSEQSFGGTKEVIIGIILCILGGFAIAGLGAFMADLDLNGVWIIVFGFITSVLLFVIFVAGGFISFNPYLKYKVTIEDEVRFNDFNEKYEIINQEGQIYTVKERE